MPDVFISYARADRARVEKLAKALEARGFSVWWDNELLAGDVWAEKIGRQLDAAKAVMVVWSNSSIDTKGSGFVRDEATAAREAEKYVPVRIDAILPPMGFRQVQAEDLSTWPGAAGQEAFERLVRVLERLRGAAAEPAPDTPFTQPGKISTAGDGAAVKKRGPPIGLIAGGAGAIVALAAGAFFFVSQGPPQPAEPSQTELGPDEQYGLSPQELNALAPDELLKKALASSSLETMDASAAEDALSGALACIARVYGDAPKTEATEVCAAAAKTSPLGQYVQSVHLRETDPAAADAALAQAAEAGDSRAQLDHGESLRTTDPAAARAEFEKCAAQGQVDCSFLLAEMQQLGEGGPKDAKAAADTYKVLTEAYHPAATREWGRALLEGVGVNRDVDEAVVQLKRAAVLRDGEASYLLAELAEAGEGGLKPEEAATFAAEAEANGYVAPPPALPK